MLLKAGRCTMMAPRTTAASVLSSSSTRSSPSSSSSTSLVAAAVVAAAVADGADTKTTTTTTTGRTATGEASSATGTVAKMETTLPATMDQGGWVGGWGASSGQERMRQERLCRGYAWHAVHPSNRVQQPQVPAVVRSELYKGVTACSSLPLGLCPAHLTNCHSLCAYVHVTGAQCRTTRATAAAGSTTTTGAAATAAGVAAAGVAATTSPTGASSAPRQLQ